jgi:hypothetical protein
MTTVHDQWSRLQSVANTAAVAHPSIGNTLAASMIIISSGGSLIEEYTANYGHDPERSDDSLQ